MAEPGRKTVSLFIPCLVDQVYPEMGMAMVRVLERLGYKLVYHPEQTCCGQPAYNAGHWDEARAVAETFIDCFQDAECIVAPSGSCTAMVTKFYADLFKDHPKQEAAFALQDRAFEFSQFLKREGRIPEISGELNAKIAFHNSCHSYRELGITTEPFEILERIRGIDLLQPDGEPVCCGFGGLFMVKYPEVSGSMAKARLAQLTEKGAELIVSNDPGCIMNLRNEAALQELPVEVIHLAELLDRASSQV